MRHYVPMVVCALAVTFAYQADAAKKKSKKAKTEEAPPPKAAEEMEWLQQGHAAFLIRDYDKALKLYRQAGEKMPKSPAVHYFIGCALKAKEDNEGALESFRTSYLMATGPESVWKSVALVQVALVSETLGDLEEAKKAWQDYVELAASGKPKPNLTALAEKRMEAIDKVLELKAKYEPVKKLITEQKDKEKAAAAGG